MMTNILLTKEKKLFGNKKILKDIYTFKTQTLNIIKEILIERQRIDDYTEPEEVQWGVGFYYSFKSNNFFLGFNPYYNEQFDAFFALDIEETKNNIILGDEKHLIYDEGYYFIPILNNKTSEGDKTILSALRKKLKDNKILEVSQVIKENFASFFCIQEKIGKVEMDKLFTEKQINEKTIRKNEKSLFVRKDYFSLSRFDSTLCYIYTCITQEAIMVNNNETNSNILNIFFFSQNNLKNHI